MSLTNKQTITYTCDKCGKEEVTDVVLLPAGAELLIPSPPYGWEQVGFYTFCADHCVLLMVDSEIFNPWRHK